MPQQISPLRPRQSWIDVLRGTSVLLVIILHARQYAFHGYVPEQATVQGSVLTDAVGLMNVSLAPLRMQLMFLLSGLFVARSLDRGSGAYLSGKLRNVLYPFVLWSLVMVLVRDGGATLIKGVPFPWGQLGAIVTGSSSLTWFLYDLFIFFLVTPYLRQFSPLRVVPVALALAWLVPDSMYQHPGLFYYFIFFYLGDWISRSGHDLAAPPGPRILVPSSLCLIALLLVANLAGLPPVWPGYLPLVLGSLPLLVYCAQAASRRRWSAPLTYIGRNSIVFYLVHYPPYLVVSYLLHKVTLNGTLSLVGLLLAGTGAPLLICLARDHLGLRQLDWLFSLPRRKRAVGGGRTAHLVGPSAPATVPLPSPGAATQPGAQSMIEPPEDKVSRQRAGG